MVVAVFSLWRLFPSLVHVDLGELGQEHMATDIGIAIYNSKNERISAEKSSPLTMLGNRVILSDFIRRPVCQSLQKAPKC